MNNFSWTKGFGFAVLIWTILFAVGAVLVLLGVTLSTGWMLGLAIAAGILSYTFAIAANSQNSVEALGYGFLWAVIGMVLDLIITLQFSAAHGVLSHWVYWVGYTLVLFAPWIEYEIQGVGAHPRAV